MPDDVTPIRQQYLSIKNQYPDLIVFFRLGDFYETFDQDAEITSRELDIVLTSRNVSKKQRIPMAGIPYHAVENYLTRLIEKGYHVAICEQVGDQPINGLVPRKVVRVITPGTVIEPGLLQSSQNNYLVGFLIEDDEAGIAFADITTGEFYATQLEGTDVKTDLFAELMRLKPAEIIFPEDNQVPQEFPGHKSPLPNWRFDFNRCQDILLRQFEVGSLEGFGLQNKNLAVEASGAVLQYLKETLPDSLKLLNRISTYNLMDFMTLDAATQRNLELTETIRKSDARGSLLHTLDFTITPMGHRSIRQWISKPLLDITQIYQRQDNIQFFVDEGLIALSFVLH